MHSIAAIVWDVDPELFPSLFESLPIHPRWYGLLFASGFLFGYQIMKRILVKEGKPLDWMDSLLIYVIIATVLGARLGHVFFYDWKEYKDNLSEIFKIWNGGLASHGAAIGILLALWFWTKRVSKMSYLWILDRIVITVALAGCFIRLGNFVNSEILGIPTDLPWGVVFARVSNVARHPAQLYEAIAYLFVFIFLYVSYWKWNRGKKQGYLFGMFLALVFGFRFLVEFIKENQSDRIEADTLLNMGQLLSIPLVIAGIFFVVRSLKQVPDGANG
ncbi:MAG: prolipoprotein diacylglyceryl transferase [Leptolyngbya sp. SIO3F4]|nr:prolipoprotein diacylglyceryl transferase [Leptolyngbya sp. SIO3F4]